jgi:hypothetical protein
MSEANARVEKWRHMVLGVVVLATAAAALLMPRIPQDQDTGLEDKPPFRVILAILLIRGYRALKSQ